MLISDGANTLISEFNNAIGLTGMTQYSGFSPQGHLTFDGRIINVLTETFSYNYDVITGITGDLVGGVGYSMTTANSFVLNNYNSMPDIAITYIGGVNHIIEGMLKVDLTTYAEIVYLQGNLTQITVPVNYPTRNVDVGKHIFVSSSDSIIFDINNQLWQLQISTQVFQLLLDVDDCVDIIQSLLYYFADASDIIWIIAGSTFVYHNNTHVCTIPHTFSSYGISSAITFQDLDNYLLVLTSYFCQDGSVYDVMLSQYVDGITDNNVNVIMTTPPYSIVKACNIGASVSEALVSYYRNQTDSLYLYINNILYSAVHIYSLSSFATSIISLPPGAIFKFQYWSNLYILDIAQQISVWEFAGEWSLLQQCTFDIHTILSSPLMSLGNIIIKYLDSNNNINYLINYSNYANFIKLDYLENRNVGYFNTSQIFAYVKNVMYNTTYSIPTFYKWVNNNTEELISTLDNSLEYNITFNIYDTAYRVNITDALNYYYEGGSTINSVECMTPYTKTSIQLPSDFTLISSINTGNVVWLLGARDLMTVDCSFRMPIPFPTGITAIAGCFTGTTVLILGTDGCIYSFNNL